jgi:hypothetical protein
MAPKSVIKILNNTGLSMEPCGTPESMEKCKEECAKVRTTKSIITIIIIIINSVFKRLSHTNLFETRQKQFILRDDPCYTLI